MVRIRIVVAVEGADLQCICEQFVEMNAKVDDGWLDCEGGLDSAAMLRVNQDLFYVARRSVQSESR